MHVYEYTGWMSIKEINLLALLRRDSSECSIELEGPVTNNPYTLQL